ncbi:Rossmann-fold NAD(P)-binding domain-containing protein [Flindersiella endophytica]
MILITGATGPVGREAVRLLLAGGHEVAAVTRDPGAADLPAQALLVRGDPSQPATLAGGLPDIDGVLLSPRAAGARIPELLRLAADHGAKRVAVLSAVTVEYGGGYRRFSDAFRAAEDAAKDSGLQWTFLRSAQYATNSLVWAPQVRAGDVVRGAYGDAAVSPIHERDIAAVAAAALLDDGHAGRSYALTGPESLSQRDQVRVIGEAVGRSLRWEEVPPEQVRAAMLAQGVPDEVPDRMLGYLAQCLAQPGPSTTTVRDVLGRPALTFAEWAAENTKAFLP